MTSIFRHLSGALTLLPALAGAAVAQGSAAPPVPKVVNSVTAAVDPASYQGPCPAKLNVTGTITMAKVPTEPIAYQWVRSDSTRSPKRTLTMTSNGAVVSDVWTVGESGQMMRLWVELHVFAPVEIKSKQATGAVLCR
jgi:hypothetical protein